ncbi:DUF6993 domain-containing protein [Gulosibacter bifidus]|uniref:DUF6993 domain-containing protein n=1 Tax=Gulosibacter bifidus TaxID=272239 RepID=A0ABW5RJH2_9MICO|nr:hypothetical protein [Gulosibacter bifidus]
MVTSRMRIFGSLAVAAALALSGCAQGDSQTQQTQGASATPKPRATFNPNGVAGDNKAYFDQTLQDLLASNEKADSKAMVQALVDAGFDKSQMEVTYDRTSIDLEVDYVMVSVKMPDGNCLLGHRGTRGYSSMVAEPMKTGKCMIGETQPIDW